MGSEDLDEFVGWDVLDSVNVSVEEREMLLKTDTGLIGRRHSENLLP